MRFSRWRNAPKRAWGAAETVTTALAPSTWICSATEAASGGRRGSVCPIRRSLGGAVSSCPWRNWAPPGAIQSFASPPPNCSRSASIPAAFSPCEIGSAPALPQRRRRVLPGLAFLSETKRSAFPRRLATCEEGEAAAPEVGHAWHGERGPLVSLPAWRQLLSEDGDQKSFQMRRKTTRWPLTAGISLCRA